MLDQNGVEWSTGCIENCVSYKKKKEKGRILKKEVG